MNTRKYCQIVLLVFMVILTSCENKKLANGFKKSGVTVDEEEKVEGRLDKSKGLEIEKDNSIPVIERYFIREEMVSVNYGANAKVKVFLVHLDEGLSKQGIANCLEGMKRFNDLHLMFRLMRTRNPQKAHIKAILKEAHEIDNFYAKTLYANNGMPGKWIKLNKSLYGGNGRSLPVNMVTVFAHELGHAFGFAHLDFADNKFSCNHLAYKEKHSIAIKSVPGTGTAENVTNSFMLACVNRYENRPLLLLDKIGIYNVYGRYKNEGLPLLRYKGKNQHGYYYTTDYNDLGEGNENYISEGIIGRIYLENTKNKTRVPLAYYFNVKSKDHFYTTDLSELGMGKRGYKFVRLYYLHADADGKSRLPLIEFYNSSKQHHFYTSDAAEAYELQNDKTWRYEGVVGYLSAN
ncbi:M57 family metalloprotease [Ascidiimonas sp. W6]|uniref:M57 family metalloprotease n=1 Tax=Ascidiimonas meishanensis TaxID=3128903 RepID=UPI0030EC22E0